MFEKRVVLSIDIFCTKQSYEATTFKSATLTLQKTGTECVAL